MVFCKPAQASTHLAAKVALTNIDGSLLAFPIIFCELVGSLQYLTLTHLDISFAINNVAHHMSSPHTTHLIATKRILYYVKGTLNFGIHLCPQTTSVALSAYLNARHSTTGYLIYLVLNSSLGATKRCHCFPLKC